MPSQRHENSYPLVLARSSHHNVTMPLQRLHQHPACGLGLRKTRTFLENGVSGHGLLRFVHLARQGVVKVTGFTDALDARPLASDALRGKCAPLRQCNRASLLVNLPGDEMPLLIEMILDLGVN
jgi:hypothetical protein